MITHEQLVRSDLEGDLLTVSREQQPPGYVKRLRLDTAWHVSDFRDLQGVDSIVATVSEFFERNCLLIEYQTQVIPLDEARLRALLAITQPLAAWRFGRLAADLSRSLAACHAAGVPQLLVHPERVAVLERRFALLPTFAGVLPPLSDWLAGPGESWLAFIAPEVLRTRGITQQILQKGDVYALGRLLARLVAPAAESIQGNAFALAEALVEQPALAFIPAGGPEELTVYHPLIARMCAFDPDERPTAREAAQELQFLAQQADPATQVSEQIDAHRLPVARAMLGQLQTDQDQPGLYYPQAETYLLCARAALAENPPSYSKAIEYYSKALQFEPRRSEIHMQLARAYLQHSDHPQHRQFAHRSYDLAVKSSGWRSDLLDEWMRVLRIDPPDRLLKLTEDIPWERRTAEVFIGRAVSYEALGDPISAWSECVIFFQRSGYEPRVYAVAEATAQQLDPLWLINWLYTAPGAEKLHPAAAIVWMRNGNTLHAAQHLALALQAVSQLPPGGVS